ncbi:MAG: AAA family ATPase [Rickettsiaceae bacterium]|nr:AAA family ATPase [Rickettsiaceae bacterium]
MNQVIILNGPSCSGKSTIAKEICIQSNNKFVHMQIDKAAEFYSTIFGKNFQFVENIPGTDNQDDGLKGLFNNNRLARRKVVASIFLATAQELLSLGFSIVIDTALDGPDSAELAKYYLDYLKGNNIKFIGIYCPLEERKKRLKTRKDNLFLTEEFLELQNDLFEMNKELYNDWFDSSKLTASGITSKLLV